MAKLFRTVKHGMTNLVRWAFENDKVAIDPAILRKIKNYRV